MIRGCDTDNYDQVVSVARFRKLHDDHNIRFNIVSLERGGPYAPSQKANCEAVGIVVPEGYRFLYWDNFDLERMKEAAGFGLPIWIDCEWADGMTGGPEATVERIATARDLLKSEGRYAGIYSGNWWWGPCTGGSLAFAGDWGWGANYPFGDALPPTDYEPDFANLVRFGGLDFKVWQYANNAYGEPGFDMNAAETAFWEDDVTNEEIALRTAVIRTLLRDDYHFKDAGVDAVTGAKIVEVLTGVHEDEAIRIRVR